MANPNQTSPRVLLRGEKPLDGSRRMNRKHAIFVATLMLALPLFTLAQDEDDKGRVWGGYTVRQSIELGSHIADAEGNQQMYSTFVNIGTGPRLLGQELSMQSRDHEEGLLFDTLYLSSFGLGGDPEGMTRLRVQKNKWYNFVGLYRRDKNYFDYDLFGNPLNLNAGITTCGTTCQNAFSPTAQPWYSNSPHMQATTRNMGDFMLTLLPESKVSFRLGYARNASYGTIDSTLESPIRTILTEDSQWRSDRYQFGADLKLLPRTTISLDFFFEHDKNDIGFLDADLLYTLGNTGGPPVDIGLLLPPLSGTLPSCAGNNVQTIQGGGVFIINPGCTGVLLDTGPGGAYFRRGHVRTGIPTGQLSLQSNYFHKLDITASGTYSSANSDFLNYNEFMHGSTASLITGSPTAPPTAGHISANADLGLTYHINKSWSVSDKFRWLDWREPGANLLNTFNCFLPAGALASPTGFPAGAVTPTSLLNPCNSNILTLSGLTTSGNAASTTAYESMSANATLYGERSYFNTARLNWQPSRRFSGYVGYRYGRREFTEGTGGLTPSFAPSTGVYATGSVSCFNTGTGAIPTCPALALTTTPLNTEEINLHTALLGVVIRPVEAWRINADVELLSADNSFTDISPRHQQRVRAYSTYKVNRWASLNAGVHFVETRNPFAGSETIDNISGAGNLGTALFPAAFVPFEYGHKDHWRSYTLGVTLNPNSKLTFDLGWTLLDQNIRSASCMPLSTATVFFGVLPAETSPPAACNNATTARALLLAYQEYTNTGYMNLSYHPVKRVTLSLGYEVTGDSGSTNWLRADNGLPLQVVGDIYGNSPPLAGNPITPCPGASVATGCVFAGPFPDQPLGPQALNWHKFNTGIAYEVVKGITFKGLWSYYDYNAKDQNPGLADLTVVAPRDFHANVGTVSLKYVF